MGLFTMETFYSIYNSANNTYLQFDSLHHITYVSNIERAYYGTMTKANAIINNCVKPEFRSNLSIVAYPNKAVSQAPKKAPTYNSPNPNNRVSHNKRISFSSKSKPNKISMSVVREVSTPCLKAFTPHTNPICDNTAISICVTEYEEKERQIKKEICDLYHYIEFYNLNAAEGYKIYKALQVRLQKRREIKNALIKLSIVSQATPDDIFSGNLERRLSGLNDRKYQSRAIPELFSGDNIEDFIEEED